MNKTKAILSMIVMMGLAGCHPGSSDPRVQTADGVQSDTLTRNVITRPIGNFVSYMMGEGIEVTNVIDRVNPQGFLEVQVEVYNHAKMRKVFDYRVEWKDKDGMILDTVMTHWISKSVMPESKNSFRVIAPSPKATDFRINTRINNTVQ